MKKTQKLSIAVIVLTMCILLGITAWAENQYNVSYLATLDKDTLCLIGEEQEVTLTAKISEDVELDSFTAQVTLPEGWMLKSVSATNMNEIMFDTTSGMILWWNEEAENVTTDQLAEIIITVPKNVTADEYEIYFEIIDISKNGGVVWETDETLTATLTVAEHEWKVLTYSDKEGDTHTANYVCANDASHTKSETVAHIYAEGECVCGATETIAPAGLKGDVDLNGVVDMNDFVALAKHIGEVEFITNEVAMSNADVTGNGTVDMDDFVKVAQYIGEVIPEL